MSIETMTDKYLSSIREDLNHSGANIFKSLVEDKELYVNAIPESLFVNYFLPFFLGRGNNPNWLMEWISIAGTPASEVRVYHDSTRETLFYVPPTLNLNNFILPNSENNLANIFARYNMYNRNLPQEGTRFLLNELEEKQRQLVDPMEHQYLGNWIGILKRYNIDMAPAAAAPQTSSNDYLDY